MRTKLLHELAIASGLELATTGVVEVRGIVRDSRRVEPQFLFCALAESAELRRLHIAEALAQGAVAIASTDGVPAGIPHLKLRQPRIQAALLAAAFFDHPAREMDLVGITGTNGKTTVAMMIESLLKDAGRPCGLIGTVTTRTGTREFASRMTTPDPEDLQALLAEMRDSGLGSAAIEVSSHALDQDRGIGLELAVAVFNRMTRDHLDYHGDIPSYHSAKMRLLELLRPGGTVVLNADTPEAARLERALPPGAQLLRYSLAGAGDLEASITGMALDGMDLVFREGEESASGRLPMIGAHNAENALAAVAALRGLGMSLTEAVANLNKIPTVPGRFEHRVAAGIDVVVDYAHSPDAFERVLGTLHGLASSRLIVVFGCGGDRDRGKRPEMGRIAEVLAHRVILSDDNPRSENPAAIVMQIRAGMKAPERALYVPDRREAILCALDEARPGDVVVLAGKGHEDYQIIGTERLHHHDPSVVRDWADWKEGRRGQAP